jgi:hypothetical protein
MTTWVPKVTTPGLANCVNNYLPLLLLFFEKSLELLGEMHEKYHAFLLMRREVRRAERPAQT